MQFDFKLGFAKKTTSKVRLIPAIGAFWQKIYMVVFFVVLVAMIVLSGYIWRDSMYGSGWSDAKKQEYLNSQNTGVVFNQQNFEKVLSDVQMRKQDNVGNQQVIKDIFKAY